ncbi:Cof-type HAD-IIB family hydrolase [Lacticaseibacillus daqingensis]|uniref:Cof-type HAD-IIB family hydrolase n=1 Tax=Lacticaseibacillus daqingensis TaxID=2486014 RepID=UPI000F765DD0|nr:Cof-type HAD-IIB family hydrolase [Lacticaseibacillus daqingensis]
MPIQLIALDIDDTLLTSQKQLLPTTIAAVQAALARGIKVVLCTGRPLAGVAHYLKALGISGPEQYVVTGNGAVSETVTGTVVAKHLIDRAGYEAMTAYAIAHHLPFNVLDEAGVIYTADHDVDAMIVVQAAENFAGLKIRQPAELPADFAIVKGLFVGPEALLDAAEAGVRAQFGQTHSVLRAGRNFLEVMHEGVTKGQALRDLGAVLGIPAANMMAVGDEGNDIAMFEAVGCAVAMGNGTEAAKAAADFVTATNDEDGLALAIKRYALQD